MWILERWPAGSFRLTCFFPGHPFSGPPWRTSPCYCIGTHVNCNVTYELVIPHLMGEPAFAFGRCEFSPFGRRSVRVCGASFRFCVGSLCVADLWSLILNWYATHASWGGRPCWGPFLRRVSALSARRQASFLWWGISQSVIFIRNDWWAAVGTEGFCTGRFKASAPRSSSPYSRLSMWTVDDTAVESLHSALGFHWMGGFQCLNAFDCDWR